MIKKRGRKLYIFFGEMFSSKVKFVVVWFLKELISRDMFLMRNLI